MAGRPSVTDMFFHIFKNFHKPNVLAFRAAGGREERVGRAGSQVWHYHGHDDHDDGGDNHGDDGDNHFGDFLILLESVTT